MDRQLVAERLPRLERRPAARFQTWRSTYTSVLALNPNKKMPTLEDDGFCFGVESILFYAPNYPEKGLWPSDLKGQADVLRWLAWQSAHWDAESCGMVSYEKASKAVLGLGPPTPLHWPVRLSGTENRHKGKLLRNSASTPTCCVHPIMVHQ